MAALTAISLGLALGGSIMNARSQVKAGKAAESAAQRQGDAEARAGLASQRAAESQAQLADYNAAVADLQAKDATQRGELDAQKFRQRTRALVGEQRTGIAAGNIDVGYGSAVDVQADATMLGELDALTVKTNAAREAWGYRVEASDLRQRGAISRQEGANAAAEGQYGREAAYQTGKAQRSAGKWNAATTIIGTGASLLESRYGFGRKG